MKRTRRHGPNILKKLDNRLTREEECFRGVIRGEIILGLALPDHVREPITRIGELFPSAGSVAVGESVEVKRQRSTLPVPGSEAVQQDVLESPRIVGHLMVDPYPADK